VLPADTILSFAIEDAGAFREAFFPSAPSDEGVFSVEKLLGMIGESDPKSRVPLEKGAALVKTLLRALDGRFVVALRETPRWPTFLFLGNVKPEAKDVAAFLSREVRPLLESLGGKMELEREGDSLRVRVADLDMFIVTEGTRLCASTDQSAALEMKKGALPLESSLAGRSPFQKAYRTAGAGDFFAYADTRKFVEMHFGGLTSATVKGLVDLGIASLDAVAFSAKADGAFLKLKFAVTNAGEFSGLPAIFLRPNTPSRAAKYVPQDYSMFLRFSTAEAREAYRQWQGIVRKMTDGVSWKEYQEGLAKLNGERGFSLEELLGNLGDEAAVAVKLPELIGIPPMLIVIEVKDEARAIEVLSRFLEQARARPQPFSTVAGAQVQTTTLVPGVMLSYAVKDGHLIIGLSPLSVASSLKAAESGDSLATSPQFQAAMKAVPDKTMFSAYVELGPVARFSFMARFAYLFMQSQIGKIFSGSQLEPDSSSQAARIIQTLTVESQRMGALTCYGIRDENTFSLHADIPMGAIRCAAAMLPEPVARAREAARREACMKNLRQIALACFMYLNDHKSMFPERLSELGKYVGNLEVFSCPETEAEITVPEDIDSKSSYTLIGGFSLKDVKNPSEKLVLYESVKNHTEGANVAFADGHVEWVSSERLQELLKQAGL
jgi:prepilin-type processing-associated H-X9-DG protein